MDQDDKVEDPALSVNDKGGRKRLSRKEQKARKRQKKEHDKKKQNDLKLEALGTSASSKQDAPPNNSSAKENPRSSKKNKEKKRKNKRKQKDPPSASDTKESTSGGNTEPNKRQDLKVDETETEDKDKGSNDDTPYVPTPIPTLNELQKRLDRSATGAAAAATTATGGKTLGKWFPSAVILKSKEPPVPDSKASLVLFYQYVDPQWPESVTQHLMAFLCHLASIRVLGGRIRVAREGVNATLSSRDVEEDASAAATTLRHFAKDLQAFSPVFAKTDFKFIDNLSGDRHFKDFKVFPVKELVFYGFKDDTAPLSKGGVHLEATEFHQKLQERDTVVVDVRNHYEAAIGRFDGQTVATASSSATSATLATPSTARPAKNKKTEHHETEPLPLAEPASAEPQQEGSSTTAGAATYVDPKMRKSTDFATWLQKPETKSQLAGKQVLLYCTGGVRCERASAHLNHSMGDQLSGVYQLKGGIERYLQTFPDGGHWRGKNFVFDKREAMSAENPDGDGGVVQKNARKKKKKKNEDDGENRDNNNDCLLPEMKCCQCQKPWDRYVGKKKCDTCGVPVLMCDACMSLSKNDTAAEPKSANQKKPQLIRCPLCVEENVTVPAKEVDFTDNGVHVSADTQSADTGTNHHPKKAAPSVLKWGGGHARQKKELRRFQRKPCKFGAACKRSDCFFAHPERETNDAKAKHKGRKGVSRK